MKTIASVLVAALAASLHLSLAQDTSLAISMNESAVAVDTEAVRGSIPICFVRDPDTRMLRKEMNEQGKKWSNDCTVAWTGSKCWVKGSCPALNTYGTAYLEGCAVDIRSISMGRHRDGGCWIECSEWTERTAMAYNCIWQQKDGNWQIWGSPSGSKTWCPGCSL